MQRYLKKVHDNKATYDDEGPFMIGQEDDSSLADKR